MKYYVTLLVLLAVGCAADVDSTRTRYTLSGEPLLWESLPITYEPGLDFALVDDLNWAWNRYTPEGGPDLFVEAAPDTPPDIYWSYDDTQPTELVYTESGRIVRCHIRLPSDLPTRCPLKPSLDTRPRALCLQAAQGVVRQGLGRCLGLHYSDDLHHWMHDPPTPDPAGYGLRGMREDLELIAETRPGRE